ncbi:MAG: OmpA family protein [Saprospiraceae bacterium]
MNSKSLVFAVFTVWSIICWRWYVCGLMNACGNAGSSKEEKVVAVQPKQIDTAAVEQTPEITPLKDDKSTNAKTPDSQTSNPKPVSPSNMDEVQMEKVKDRMLIYFPYKSSRKEDNAAIDAYLTNLAAQLISSGQKVTITGHTDFVGEPKENYNFGLRRAYGIREILVKKGVPKSQIRCKSYGDSKPLATNDTPYGRYQNRRAEIRVGK